jgi:hypothetical protein
MNNRIILLAALVMVRFAVAADPDPEIESKAVAEGDVSQQGSSASNVADGPKTLSGMSILGNEEAPKALVIVPWKSSQLGIDDLGLNDSLDDQARPVDREVFLRELSYYDIRSGR